MREIVIQVPEIPLPSALIESAEYKQLSTVAREAWLGHIRYMQELPYKLREWLDAGGPVDQLEALVNRVDLDLTIHLGVPKSPQDAVSPWIVRSSWVSHTRALTAFLDPKHVVLLNQSTPRIGVPANEVEAWLGHVADGLSGLFEAFFAAKTFDHVVAYLVAIYVYLAGLKFGLGRVGLQYPK